MRKNIAVLFCMPILAIVVVVMTACGSVYDRYKSKLSDFRDTVLRGVSESYEVELISGVRESDFALDGVSNKKIDYTVITVNPLISVDEVGLSLAVSGEDYSVTCNKHPLGSTFSAEIPSRFIGGEIEILVNQTAVVLSVPHEPPTITGADALEIADSAINLESAEEIYVRIIDNPITNDGFYYWYVATYNSDGTKAVLIDITTGEILARR